MSNLGEVVNHYEEENERLRERIDELEEACCEERLTALRERVAELEKDRRPQLPDGKLSDDDEGEVDVLVGSDVAKAVVIISFPSPVAWAAMSPAQAREVASSLERHAVRAEKKPEETP